MAFFSMTWLCGIVVTRIFRRGITSLLSPRNLLGSTFPDTRWNSSVDYSSLTQPAKSSFDRGARKPPNVLIFTGTADINNKKFNHIRNNLQKCLSRDSYVIYKLEENQLTEHPWSENSALLVIHSEEDLKSQVLEAITLYLVEGGKVLILGSNTCSFIPHGLTLKSFEKGHQANPVKIRVKGQGIPDELLEMQSEPYYFEELQENSFEALVTEYHSGSPVVIQSSKGKGTIILSQLHLVPDLTADQQHDNTISTLLIAVLSRLDIKCNLQKIPGLSPAYLIADEKHTSQLMQSLQSHLEDGMCRGRTLSLIFCTTNDKTEIQAATEEMLPVIVEREGYNRCRFDWQMYKQHLSSHTLGQIVLYTEVIPSTQIVFENHTFVQCIPQNAGVAVVACQQVKGKGRSGNAWLSPIGCMMFSLQVKLDFGTELGSRLPYVQHIASLALVEAVRELPGYEDIDVRLKWPNDIYYGRNIKIGGVLVTSSTIGNELSTVVGMGVNVSNSEPTSCINDIIRQYNKQHETNLAPLPLEMVLARTISYMEQLINEFQQHGKDVFLSRYYKRWLHGGSEVTLNIGNPETVTIVGLDNFGFLSVQKASGEICSVQPDGNTFDMLANLIQIKY